MQARAKCGKTVTVKDWPGEGMDAHNMARLNTQVREHEMRCSFCRNIMLAQLARGAK